MYCCGGGKMCWHYYYIIVTILQSNLMYIHEHAFGQMAEACAVAPVNSVTHQDTYWAVKRDIDTMPTPASGTTGVEMSTRKPVGQGPREQQERRQCIRSAKQGRRGHVKKISKNANCKSVFVSRVVITNTKLQEH